MKNNILLDETFRNENIFQFQELLGQYDSTNNSKLVMPNTDIIKVDMHCHDYNSDIPDELWGRLLGLPETWTTTEKLLKVQKSYGVDLPCVTNHNNARSSWELLDKGIDVLVAAEFTCHFVDHPCSLHVLAYGFNPEQEQKLNRYRHNIMKFLEYAHTEDIPLSLPHPLFYYMSSGDMDMEFFEKLLLLFERFEVFNGQRDVWQNLSTWKWIEGITEEKMQLLSKKHGIGVKEFCPRHPFQKVVVGGSDDHFGIFSGQVGSELRLSEGTRGMSLSARALEAIREGTINPYGVIGEEEKLSVAFMEYFCQVAQNMKDPGLIRLLLHKGSLQDKLATFALGNGMMELARHKSTMKFFSVFQESLRGKKPSKLTRWMVHKDYTPILDSLTMIADTRKESPEKLSMVLSQKLPDIYNAFSNVLLERAKKAVKKNEAEIGLDPTSWLRSFEIPLHFRSWGKKTSTTNDKASRPMQSFDPSEVLDELSFPALGAVAMASTSFGASKVMYQNRDFMGVFSKETGIRPHPEKILWLTDTFVDKNGVSSVLKQALNEIRQNDLPIDILVCSNSIISEDHLVVVPSLEEFKVPNFETQSFQIPDLMQIQSVFKRGGYDRILCSTELIMGGVALFLKEAFNVPAYFFMHTDWMDFARRNLSLNYPERDRLRRILRGFYQNFDGVFALNKEHKKWLQSKDMELKEEQVLLTSHWAKTEFVEDRVPKEKLFGVPEETFVLLFAGRLSKEKGVLEACKIYEGFKAENKNVKLVFAGTGPMEDELKLKVPEAIFMGWLNSKELIQSMSTADFLLLPNRFDTFGCVVLEAMACGTPVCAFNSKGPADIIDSGMDGFLTKNSSDATQLLLDYASKPEKAISFRRAALDKNKQYNAKIIMEKMLVDMGITKV
ncbi:glycosyltransferase [bacterium]|nr:glycosyltransferase [bacterium]